MIRDSVRFLTERGREVIFDAEHFFDGWKDDSDYAEAVLKTAEAAGAAHAGALRHQRRDASGRNIPHCERPEGENCRTFGDSLPQRRRLRRGQQPDGGQGGGQADSGHPSGLRRAVRERKPFVHPADAAAEMGVYLRSGGVPSEPDPLRPGGGGGGERDPRSRASLCGEQRLRSQGRGCTSTG